MNQETKKLLEELKASPEYYALSKDQITTLVSTLEYNESYQRNLREAQWDRNKRIRELEEQIKEFQAAIETPSLRIEVLRKSVEEDWSKWRKIWRHDREQAEHLRINAYSKQAYIASLEKDAMGREKDKLAQRIGRQRKVNRRMHQQVGRMRFILHTIVEEVEESLRGSSWKDSLKVIRHMANQALEKGRKNGDN